MNSIIHSFNKYSTWLNHIEHIDTKYWSMPIKDGKWSVSEIVAHITNWDQHLLTKVLPAVRMHKGMEFPEFDSYNKKAANYAKSGVTKSKLLEEAKRTRELLVKELSEMANELLHKPLTANGVTHCPHTGTPYSLIYIVKEFGDHDEHHKGQIINFLKENNLD